MLTAPVRSLRRRPSSSMRQTDPPVMRAASAIATTPERPRPTSAPRLGSRPSARNTTATTIVITGIEMTGMKMRLGRRRTHRRRFGSRGRFGGGRGFYATCTVEGNYREDEEPIDGGRETGAEEEEQAEDAPRRRRSRSGGDDAGRGG